MAGKWVACLAGKKAEHLVETKAAMMELPMAGLKAAHLVAQMAAHLVESSAVRSVVRKVVN